MLTGPVRGPSPPGIRIPMAATKKAPARKAPAKRRPKRTPVREHLAPWKRDAWGIGLVVGALLFALALWFQTGFPFGRFVLWLGRGTMGAFAVMIPVLLIYWGGLLIFDRVPEARLRMAIGFGGFFLGLLGAASLFMGNPRISSGFTGVAHAAGMIGALAASPLSRVVSPIGAGIVCAGVMFLGALVFTGTSFARLMELLGGFAEQLREAMRPAETEPVDDGSAGLVKLRPSQRRINLGDEDGLEERADGQLADVVQMPARAEGSEESIAPRKKRKRLGSVGEEILAAAAAAGVSTDDASDEDASEDESTPPMATPRPKPDQAYELPPLDLLRTSAASHQDGLDVEETMEALERTFQMFGVDAHVPTAHRGPTVTLFEVEVAPGTKVNKVLALSDDIAYALATPDVRIIAPIPGRSAIGVEVPNKHREFVLLGDILGSKAAGAATHKLEVALGKDVQGRAHMVNLATMPHVLIAGATGAGKSSLVNCFLTSLLMRTTPDDVRIMLVDPKRVEMAAYAQVPHLLAPVIVHPKRAAEALQWIVREMERRYEMLATVGVRDIDGYEEGLRSGTLRIPPGMESSFEHLPFIVVVIDELADLMMVAPRDVEDAICRIAQMARAVGIHLVVATQRPSVDVVTGLIKANIPSRIALMTSSQADSRVILDMNGAEKLVGHGDMLFAPANASKPTRLQGAWVTEEEVRQVAAFTREQREVVYEQSVEGMGLPPTDAELAMMQSGGAYGSNGGGNGSGSDDDAELMRQAMDLVIRSQLGSTSMLQRKLKVGFARAGRLMDLLEDQGVVGPSQGSKARDVLITPEEWEEMQDRSA